MTNGLAYLEKENPERKIKRISQLDGYFLSGIVESTDGNFFGFVLMKDFYFSIR